jgi:acyl-CoA synthetase (NDP forming)
MALLARSGIPTARLAVAGSAAEAEKIAGEFNFPVVVKAELPHKTDKGLVKTNLTAKNAVRMAYQEVAGKLQASPDTAGCGVLVQEMVRGGIEVIIGVKNDPIFGPAVLFGMGGILTEVMKDVSLRVCPLSRTDVREMMAEVKGIRLLRGFRGQGAFDVAALEETLLRVSALAYQLKERLVELDINPVIVLPEGQGVKAVDALVVLK